MVKEGGVKKSRDVHANVRRSRDVLGGTNRGRDMLGGASRQEDEGVTKREEARCYSRRHVC